MFGMIVSGRLVQTQFEQISETKFVTTILEADNVNHIVVFLTGVLPFPEGTAGQVYFSWPDPLAPPTWQLLGHISNSKPSAIFKLSGLKKPSEIDNSININTFGQQAISHNAQIGISVEPLTNIQDVPPTEGQEYVTFAQKMLESFMNYTLSFTTTQSQMMLNPTATYVPISAIQNWYRNFERRLSQNPNFWKS